MTNLIPSAEYGIAVFVIAGLFYLVGKGLDTYCKMQERKNPVQYDNTIVIALDNNTKAMEGQTKVIETIISTLTTINDRQIKTTAMVEEIVAKQRAS